jgi:hypothetical protein
VFQEGRLEAFNGGDHGPSIELRGAGKTGRRSMVKVRYSEGVAIHTGPESCAGQCREAVRRRFC